MRPVSIANHHPRLRVDRRAITSAIHALDAAATHFRGGPPAGELSLVLLTDAALAKLHADFLDDPTLTDVITFEGNPVLGVAGEICVSADAAVRQVGQPRPGQSPTAKKRRQVSDRQTAFSTELTLYLVHGWLHLAGYDDLEPAKKRVMRRAEARAMRLLSAEGSLPAFTLRGAAR